MTPAAIQDAVQGRRMVLQRLIAAPVAAVWAAWTDASALPRWWGPNGFTCKTREIDLRQGGLWRFDMIGPDGTVYPNRHRYTLYETQSRICYILDDDDTDGSMGPKNVTIQFEPQGNTTRLTLTMDFADETAAEFARNFGAVELGYETLDKLAQFVIRHD